MATKKRKPGWAGTVPVPVLLAASRFLDAREVRVFIRPVWIVPDKRAVLATNGHALFRAILTKDGAKRLKWTNPGRVDNAPFLVSPADALKWLRSKKSPKPSEVRLVHWADGQSVVKAKDGDKLDVSMVGSGWKADSLHRVAFMEMNNAHDSTRPLVSTLTALKPLVAAAADLGSDRVRIDQMSDALAMASLSRPYALHPWADDYESIDVAFMVSRE